MNESEIKDEIKEIKKSLKEIEEATIVFKTIKNIVYGFIIVVASFLLVLRAEYIELNTKANRNEQQIIYIKETYKNATKYKYQNTIT